MKTHLHDMNHKHRRRRRPLPATTNKPASTCSSHLKHPNPSFANLLFVLLSASLYILSPTAAQQPDSLLMPGHAMENLKIPESLPVDSVVHVLKTASSSRRFSYHLSGEFLKVNETSGEVRLAKPLDRERESKFTTFINVLDMDDSKGENVGVRLRTVTVEDVDDSWPIFASHELSVPQIVATQTAQYHVDINETAPPNSTVIADIKVSDADEGQNAEIVFECSAKKSSNSACDLFSLEHRRLGPGRYSLTIRTRSPLDYERTQAFKISLIARGKKPSPLIGRPLETEAIVFVDVVNIQDEAPAFLNAPYTVSIREGIKPGTKLLNLFVQDGDSAPQRDISMIVVNNNQFRKYFEVTKDPVLDKVWHLESGAVIDREDPAIQEVDGIFTINLLAVELDKQGQPVASESELRNALNQEVLSPKGTIKKEIVNVVVIDLPDTKPVFVAASSGKRLASNSTSFSLLESIQTGASVPGLDLAVIDLDQGINSKFNLSLVDLPDEPPASLAFELESKVVYGQKEVIINVLNSSLLDYENPAQRTYKFHLVASKDSDPTLRQVLEVQIDILDANDNAPEFSQEQYVLQVNEGTNPGSVLTTITATDKDSAVFGKVRYTLYGTGADRFRLNPDEGHLLVNECGTQPKQCLDFEQQSVYSLTYEARDRGGLATNASLIINIVNINDHAPVFSEPIYRCELISDNLSSKHSYISPQLIVKAHDDDELSQATKNITYKIKNSNLTDLDIDPNSGLVYLASPVDLDKRISTLAALGKIDPNKQITFEADVVAEDNGEPMLSSTVKILLSVRGNPEGAPRFRQDHYQTTVLENQPKDTPFFRVQAVDPDDSDSHLRYSLGYDLNDIVNVNALTGELSFKTKVDYDDFRGVPYNITVYASDRSQPYPLKAITTVGIHIEDINDKKPKFEEKEYKAFLVQGRSKPDDIILQVKALDPDKSAQLNYSIVQNQLTVHDKNGQQFSLDELANMTTGYLSQMNRAHRNQLVNSFTTLVRIDKSSGIIQLRSEPDYSFGAAMTILVRVVDLNQDASSTSQQDFASCTFFFQTRLDKSPIFAPPWSSEKTSYNISMLEELSVGTVVFSLLARDPMTNNRIESFEKVYESDPNDYFRVDRDGIVYVNHRIDYEELPASKELSLTVKAMNDRANDDTHYYSTATLHIKVIDLNDNTPRFKSQNYTVSVSESVTYPKQLLKVEAEDRDSLEFNQVHYSLSGYSSNRFSIDAKKGFITPREGLRLDKDTEPNHILLVTASDCPETKQPISEQNDSSYCRKSSVFVNITLIDENDNDPVFMNVNRQGELEVLVSETVSVGSVIAQLIASDMDEGQNGLVGYEIIKSPEDHVRNMFSIDKEGFVRVSESLSGLGRPLPYKIPVRAHDFGKPDSRQSFATILLTINDVVSNDGVPKFVKPSPDEVVTVSEATGPGMFVYQVQAIDPDEEANGKVTYKFVQASDVFEIDPFTGVIKTQQRHDFQLDREMRENYTLIVIAQDLGTPVKQAHQILTIRVTDVNDNEPYFDRAFDDPPVVLEVQEEVAKDYLVGTIHAIDKDEGLNAMIGYEILDGNLNNLFRLESESTELGKNPCNIYSNGRLDKEVRESYTLTIKATSTSRLKNPFINQLKNPLGDRNPFNQYNASDLTKIRVTIKLLDINDNRPIFAEQNPKIVVDSSAEIYSQLMVVRASDADSSNSEVQYSLLDVLFHSDFRYSQAQHSNNELTTRNHGYSYLNQINQPVSLRHVFDIDPLTGILRNSVPLKSYVDGYFQVFVKADTGATGLNMLPGDDESSSRRSDQTSGCMGGSQAANSTGETYSKNATSSPYAELENCFVAVNRVTIFITHQRETFRFIFNKTKLNDRYDEFKLKVQQSLEKLMFEGSSAASAPLAQASVDSSAAYVKAEPRIHLNTINTDFYEREDGSLDFSILTSCSQLVKFDDSQAGQAGQLLDEPHYKHYPTSSFNANSQVPNQVVDFNEVLNLFKTLNATQVKQHQKNNLFSQYGLLNIERCLNDKALYRMSPSERVTLYFAAMIAIVGLLLAFIVSSMRKSYEKNLKLLQRSKYQYMSQYATLHPGLQGQGLVRPLHHMSLNGLQAHPANHNFISPTYGSHLDFAGPGGDYDSWQM